MEPLDQRTKRFALNILVAVEGIPRSIAGRAIAGQLVRSGTSVGANYRAARRARSKAEFIAKLGVVEEEADETLFWLELLRESGILSREALEPLLLEANELVAIMATSRKTAKVKS